MILPKRLSARGSLKSTIRWLNGTRRKLLPVSFANTEPSNAFAVEGWSKTLRLRDVHLRECDDAKGHADAALWFQDSCAAGRSTVRGVLVASLRNDRDGRRRRNVACAT